MSYLQLEIDGIARGWKANQMTLVLLSQYTDNTNKETQDATAAYALFYAGLRANCYVKREEPDFTFEQACDWFDKLTNEQVLGIKKTFDESTDGLAKIEGGKKKLRTKKNIIKSV